ncbi:MAG: DUF6067 family protein [Verrucomicrobia bacterium]|nr:DUF6067 family protein [Verrucomicrobiota bacterium]
MNKYLLAWALLGAFGFTAIAEQLGDYAREEQNLPASDKVLMKQLPYAYYPSQGKLDVALQIDDSLAAKAGWTAGSTEPHAVRVRIVPLAPDAKVIEAGTITLNDALFARKLLPVPNLPDGEYAVEYQFGPKTVRSPKTFKRLHFPWESEKIADSHTVYPPFVPVTVTGNQVNVVGRSYTINAFGLFDSVVSLDRELLARPMSLRLETDHGEASWTAGSVRGHVLHPDLAVFTAEASSDMLRVKSEVQIQEDGSAKVTMRLSPGEKGGSIRGLMLEIPIKEDAHTLFHFVGDNSMRSNYGGRLPHGGKIVWDITTQIPSPIVWKAEPGPNDGVLWDSTKVKQWNNPQRADSRPFVPYIWLGAEERGLAWFGESESGYVVADKPIQEIERKGDTVILRIRLIGKPVTLDKERTIVFGLMASPGKPMTKGWREHLVASGIGPVICWGGWVCASKYPDNGDYSIVDKVQEARKTGKVDTAWFEERSKHLLWPDRKIQDDPKAKSWLENVLFFAQRAAKDDPKQSRKSFGVYFEEHATDTHIPEWEVFQDEWASIEFPRFQTKRANWGVFAQSYRDFALWHANQWMSRGVSLYFDNTNPKRCYNERFGPAWCGEDGSLRFGTAIWGPREYYKRIWKLMAEWNAKGAPYPIDVTYHTTNTETLPINTWSSALLDHEQQTYRKREGSLTAEGASLVKPANISEEEWFDADLPWPADHTRAVSMRRQSGSIPLTLDTLRGGNRNRFYAKKDQRTVLANWGMRMVHEIPDFMPRERELSLKYEQAFRDFGYPTKTVVSNYWEEKPAVLVDDPEIKWIYLLREESPRGLLLLQSYNPDAVTTKVSLPHGSQLVDVETGESIPLTGTHPAEVTVAANYGTRMFFVLD